MANKEVVLITGGSGFLGQHIVKELQQKDDLDLQEIRIVDLKPFSNNLDYKESVPIKYFAKDITERTALGEIFQGVTCVIHCAALISYEFPAEKEKLLKNNVQGTRNIVDLCKAFDISKLIFTSTAEVCYVPYIGSQCVSAIINQTEVKALPNNTGITEYAASKLEAEDIILKANGSKTKNGRVLRTVSLRPPLIYGEGDTGLMMSLLKTCQLMGGVVPRLAGTGGKQQMAYAGNVAWSHICAIITLQKEESIGTCNNKNISGLPVFVTDDTTISDMTRLCEKLTTSKSGPLVKQSWWSVPILLSFPIALLSQFFIHTLQIKLPISPSIMISYLGSFLFFSRLRAAICQNYSPIYKEDESLLQSAKYYCKMYRFMEKQNYYNNKIKK